MRPKCYLLTKYLRIRTEVSIAEMLYQAIWVGCGSQQPGGELNLQSSLSRIKGEADERSSTRLELEIGVQVVFLPNPSSVATVKTLRVGFKKHPDESKGNKHLSATKYPVKHYSWF